VSLSLSSVWQKNNSLKLWQNIGFCEIENHVTDKRANDPVKPTLSLEQRTDGLSDRETLWQNTDYQTIYWQTANLSTTFSTTVLVSESRWNTETVRRTQHEWRRRLSISFALTKRRTADCYHRSCPRQCHRKLRPHWKIETLFSCLKGRGCYSFVDSLKSRISKTQ
jgi:hypothetical protein